MYDVTPFLNEHPGGKKILLKVAGTDASKQFDQFHNKAILDKYGPKLYKGDIGNGVEELKKEDAAEEPLSGLEEGEAFGEGIPFGDPSWYQVRERPHCA